MPDVTITTSDDFDFAKWLDDKPKKPPEPVVYKHDPVALAISSYRIWRDTGMRWVGFDDLVPLEEDIVRADELRAYYAGQGRVCDGSTARRLLSEHTGTSPGSSL